MGHDISVWAIKPRSDGDERFMQMKAIWDACEKAGIEKPAAVLRYFMDGLPGEGGLFNLKGHPSLREMMGMSWEGGVNWRVEVEVHKLPPGTEGIRFCRRDPPSTGRDGYTARLAELSQHYRLVKLQLDESVKTSMERNAEIDRLTKERDAALAEVDSTEKAINKAAQVTYEATQHGVPVKLENEELSKRERKSLGESLIEGAAVVGGTIHALKAEIDRLRAALAHDAIVGPAAVALMKDRDDARSEVARLTKERDAALAEVTRLRDRIFEEAMRIAHERLSEELSKRGQPAPDHPGAIHEIDRLRAALQSVVDAESPRDMLQVAREALAREPEL